MGADDDDAGREVAAMQFAGGMSIALVAEEWERSTAWVEESVRRALLTLIPKRDGGLKASRTEKRAGAAAAAGEALAVRTTQGELEW